jgi:hypothetical protein
MLVEFVIEVTVCNMAITFQATLLTTNPLQINPFSSFSNCLQSTMPGNGTTEKTVKILWFP